jgi:amino acid permease
VNNLTYNEPNNFLVPFGVILFAFLGAVAIPEVAPDLKKEKKYLKSVILFATFGVGVLYLLFAFSTLGVTGRETTELATTGLGQAVGLNLNLISNLFAIFAMSTSFLALSLAVKWVLTYDYGMNKYLALVLTCVPPLLFALSGFASFTKVMGIAGAIGGGMESVLILIMYNKAKKYGDRKPEYSLPYHEYLNYLLISILVFGITYSIYSIIRV